MLYDLHVVVHVHLVVDMYTVVHNVHVHLVVGFVLDPAAWVASDQSLADFVIGEDDQGEGHGDEPPGPLDGVHSQHGVGAGAVGEEGGQAGLLQQTGNHDLVLHALLEDGQAARLADQQVGPLDNDDGGEEHGVAGELDDLALRVGPLLAVRVDQVVVVLVVPVDAEADQVARQETVLHKNDNVADETGKGLDHTDLTVGHGDEALVDQLVGELVARVALHDVGLGLLIGKGNGWQQIGTQINAQNGDSTKGQWN